MLSTDHFLFTPWHAGLVSAVLLSSLVQRLLTLSDPDSPRLLRNNLLFGGLCLASSLLGQLLQDVEVLRAAALFEGAAALGLGVLLIRICGLTLFRALLPVLQLQMPRIMEDMLLVAAYLIWSLVWLRAVGLNLTGLVTTSAVLTAVLAFAMQDTLGNVLGGLALQLDNSVRVGDWIRLDEVRGQVIEVRWRHTAVRTGNGHLIVIPNSTLMKSKVEVYSRGGAASCRRWVSFWVGDQFPPQDVISCVESALRQTLIAHVANNKPPECIVTDCRDGALHYALRYWLNDPAHDDGTDSVVRIHLYSALQRAGLLLAHPCMDVRLNTVPKQELSAQKEAEQAGRLAALARVQLFACLNEEELHALAQSLRNAPFIQGNVITSQGAVAHWLYVLASGEADVWDETPEQPRRHLATLMPGEVFGEIGLLTGAPRVATVTARTHVQCYRLDKAQFERVLHARPALAEEFARSLYERSQGLEVARSVLSPQSGEQQQASYLKSIRRFFGLR